MDSFLSMFPKNLFGCSNGGAAGQQQLETIVAGEATAASSLMLVEENGRKRARGDDEDDEDDGDAATAADSRRSRDRASGSRTPALLLVTPPRHHQRSLLSLGTPEDDGAADEDSVRPVKRFRGERRAIPITPCLKQERGAEQDTAAKEKEEIVPEEVKTAPPPTLSKLPEDILTHCLSFLGSVGDRHSLQCTSKQFRKVSNSENLLKNVQVGGDRQTGLHGIIREHDTPETASDSLQPFADAGNLEAIYM